MDIICARCLEPWDSSYVQQEMTPEERQDLQAGQGCSCACRANPPSRSGEADGASTVQLPGDLDRTAALTDDFGRSL